MKIIQFSIDNMGRMIVLYDDGTLYICELTRTPRENGTGSDYSLVEPEPIGLPIGPN